MLRQPDYEADSRFPPTPEMIVGYKIIREKAQNQSRVPGGLYSRSAAVGED